MPDLALLRFIWWVLIGILFMGFAISDGFDMGIAAIYPFVARTDKERRIVLNTIGPVFEGNQVWIVLAAGATFAAWPMVYAVAFSGLYFLILLLLLTMGILRAVSFKYRSKLQNTIWRRFWDQIIFIGGLFPALIFGILLGNILQGLPFSFDQSLRMTYSGTWIELFSFFPLWCGFTSLAMLIMHGGLYLAIKSENPIRNRAILCSQLSAILLIIFFALGGLWISQMMGYTVESGVDPMGYSNPLHKVVALKGGAWIENYLRYPLAMLVPALGFIGAFGAFLLAHYRNSFLAFIFSSLSIIGIIGTVGVSLFPFILPSKTDLVSSLLVWDASSSRLTLLLMLLVTIVFMPIILLYTSWVYHVLRGKVTEKMIEKNHSAY